MVTTADRSTWTYVYATRTYSGTIVNAPIFSWTSVNSSCDPPSTTKTVGFLTRDPIGYWDGAILYGFLVKYLFRGVDPDGLRCKKLYCDDYMQAKYGKPTITIDVIPTFPGRNPTCPVEISCDFLRNQNAYGITDPGPPIRITISLFHGFDDLLDFDLIFAHELQHAKDECNPHPIGWPKDDCARCLDKETRAYFAECAVLYPVDATRALNCAIAKASEQCVLANKCSKSQAPGTGFPIFDGDNF